MRWPRATRSHGSSAALAFVASGADRTVASRGGGVNFEDGRRRAPAAGRRRWVTFMAISKCGASPSMYRCLSSARFAPSMHLSDGVGLLGDARTCAGSLRPTVGARMTSWTGPGSASSCRSGDGEATVARAVRSVVAAAPVGTEIVVVDDGSVDGSAAMPAARRCDCRAGRARRGVGRPQRRAAAATGRWLALVDADDLVGPGWWAAFEPHLAGHRRGRGRWIDDAGAEVRRRAAGPRATSQRAWRPASSPATLAIRN